MKHAIATLTFALNQCCTETSLAQNHVACFIKEITEAAKHIVDILEEFDGNSRAAIAAKGDQILEIAHEMTEHVQDHAKAAANFQNGQEKIESIRRAIEILKVHQ